MRGNLSALNKDLTWAFPILMLAVAMNHFGQAGSDAALVITIAYIIQFQSASWYLKFNTSLFDSPDSELHPTERGRYGTTP